MRPVLAAETLATCDVVPLAVLESDANEVKSPSNTTRPPIITRAIKPNRAVDPRRPLCDLLIIVILQGPSRENSRKSCVDYGSIIPEPRHDIGLLPEESS